MSVLTKHLCTWYTLVSVYTRLIINCIHYNSIIKTHNPSSVLVKGSLILSSASVRGVDQQPFARHSARTLHPYMHFSLIMGLFNRKGWGSLSIDLCYQTGVVFVGVVLMMVGVWWFRMLCYCYLFIYSWYLWKIANISYLLSIFTSGWVNFYLGLLCDYLSTRLTDFSYISKGIPRNRSCDKHQACYSQYSCKDSRN